MIQNQIQRASDRPLGVLRHRNRKENDMETEKVMEKEGYELDMDVEPTAEEIAEAEKNADEWEAEQDG